MGDIVLTDNAHYSAIAGAIRTKNGSQTTYTPAEMAPAILALPSGSTEVVAVTQSIAPNGGTAIDITAVDISDTTAVASDVANGKYFYNASGVKTAGTATISVGGDAVAVRTYADTNGGTVTEITSVDISSDTVDAAHLLSGYTAHAADGTAITGQYTPPSLTLQSKSETYTPTSAQQTDTITPDNGYDGLSSVSITVNAAPSPSLQNKSKSYTPSGSAQSERVSADSGYDGLSYVDISVAAATLQTKTVSYTPASSQQTATITADNGYYGLSSVGISVAAAPSPSLQTKSATYTPSSSAQTDTITPDAGYDGLSSVSITVDAAPSTSKNVQIASGVNRVATTSYTEVSGQVLTVAKSGTYDVYWTGYRSSTSGTNGSQLYINDSAYGSAQTTFSSNGQSVHLSNVSLTAGAEVAVRARARSTSYYMYVGNLTIVEA